MELCGKTKSPNSGVVLLLLFFLSVDEGLVGVGVRSRSWMLGIYCAGLTDCCVCLSRVFTLVGKKSEVCAVLWSVWTVSVQTAGRTSKG